MRRNFGTMHYAWQDRKTKDQVLTGFHITYMDGHEQDIIGGLVDIPASAIEEHGAVIKAIDITESKAEGK